MTPLDWTICGAYLVLVTALGWWCSRGQETAADYFVGNRKMNWIAIGMSLFATTFSSLSFVGLPREAAYEDYHLYTAILFIPLVVSPIVGWLFVPLYHRLRLISAYEYLERRFDRRMRLLGSLLANLYTLGWMGSMLYATCLILQAALGLSEEGRLAALIGLGVLTTVYTALGGFQAVVWTDVAQTVILFGGMGVVLVLGLARIPGGWETVWRVGNEHGRFDMFDLRFDLSERANFYSAAAYGVFVYLAAHATGQGAVQRYVSMPSVSAARWSLVVNGVLVAVVCLLFFAVGSVIFAFYQSPLPAGAAAGIGFPGPDTMPRKDQITPYFVQHVLAAPGLMGLLLAGLFAAVMSSIDSGINSMSALVACDWLRGRELTVRMSRILCGLFGAAAIGAALLVPSLGPHVFDIIITIAGAFFGPLLGVFALGMFVPRANAAGAAIGLLGGAVGLAAVYPTSVSPWWYGAFTCVPTFVVGCAASLLFPAPDEERLHGLVAFPRAGSPASAVVLPASAEAGE